MPRCQPRSAVALLNAAWFLCCNAQPLPSDEVSGWRSKLELDNIAPTQPATAIDERRGLGDEGLRARWWFGRGGPVEVGAGADWPAPAMVSQGTRTVVGLRAEVLPQTHVVYEIGAASRPWQTGAEDRQAQLVLEFRGKRTGYANAIPGGLLRLQMSSTSSLQLRPRSGGLVASYRARF